MKNPIFLNLSNLYMIKLKLILVLLLSITTLPSFSQSIPKDLLKEINLRLAEGLECKQLVEEKSNQVSILEDLINEQADKVDNLQDQITLLTENNAISEGREKAAMDLANDCKAEKEKAHRDVERLKKGRRTWRMIAGIETAVLIGIGVLIFR